MAKLIYVDSGVLLAAARGHEPIAQPALDVLDDPDAQFASSVFVRLEILPKALYYGQQEAARFYETFFGAVAVWAEPTPELIQAAYSIAVEFGLSALDALHVAAASAVSAAGLVTSERLTSPLLRSKLLPIRTIWAG